MESFDELCSLVDYWFQDDVKNNWFDSTPEFDKLIKTKYSTLLLKYDISQMSNYNINYILDRYKLSLGLIILHDQIPRHIYRNHKNEKNDNKEQIKKHLDDIMDFTKTFYIKNQYDMKDEHFCFVMLPLRHTNNFDNIMFVIEETKLCIKNNKNNLLYKRFFKATLERYIKLNDDKENILLSNNNDVIHIINDKNQICEKEFIQYHPLTFEELSKKIADILVPVYITEFIDNIKQNIKNNTIENGIISLSGGVDSMVMSYFLKFIGVNINAIHINYNNREECSDECNILDKWCNFLNIKLYIRKIIEINRKDMMEWNMRDLYESYTRDIRYNAYIHCVNYDEFGNNIFMGHNHDDQFENIFTNIVSESHYINLRGMKVKTTQKFKDKEINFIRPMLDIPKEIIYKIASYIGIPYFKDSTPKWSQRGKIRDCVRPQIEQWDNRAITSFFKLSDKLSDLMIITETITKNLAKQIKITKSYEINLDELEPKIFYELLFKHLEIQMTQKGIKVFYDKLQFIKMNKEKYNVNSIEKITLNKDNIIKWKKIDNMNIVINF
jgi:tRNA(Ile)-lysidine synthetase-like protein